MSISRRKLLLGSAAVIAADRAADAQVWFSTSLPNPNITTKMSQPNGADSFFITSNAGNGKALSWQVFRGNENGGNDAGTAHQNWRKGPMQMVDVVGSDSTLGGWRYIAQSNGAQDYALKISGSPDVFGGSYHGGETINEQALYVDGVPFDPTTTVSFSKLEIISNSNVNWVAPNPVGSYQVQYYCKWEVDNVFLQEFTIMSLTGTQMANQGQTSEGYITLAFFDPRFSNVIINGVTTALTMSGGGVNNIGTSVRDLIFQDPISGDQVEVSFTLNNAVGASGLWIWYNTNYAKLYVPTPGGVLGVWQVTRIDTYRMAPIISGPPLPFTDYFSGSALSSYWTVALSTGADNSVVASNQWVLTSNGTTNNYVFPLNFGLGTYQVQIDYFASSGTGSTAFIVRSNGGSTASPLVGGVSLNSATPTTATLNITITQGMTPWLMINHSVPSGRVLTITQMRITKTG